MWSNSGVTQIDQPDIPAYQVGVTIDQDAPSTTTVEQVLRSLGAELLEHIYYDSGSGTWSGIVAIPWPMADRLEADGYIEERGPGWEFTIEL